MFVDKFLEIEGIVRPADAGEDRLNVRHGHPLSWEGGEQNATLTTSFWKDIEFWFKSSYNSGVKLTNERFNVALLILQ